MSRTLTGRLEVRLSDEERGALSALAARERRTLGATVRWLIAEATGLSAPKDAAERRRYAEPEGYPFGEYWERHKREIERLRGILSGGVPESPVRERIVELESE